MAGLEVREPTFFVLAALADGRKHGWAVIKEAERLSGGRVQLKVGTLYAAIERLGEQGLVESAGDEIVDGRLRRYFALTDEGVALLQGEAERMEDNARQARAQLAARLGLGSAPGAATAVSW